MQLFAISSYDKNGDLKDNNPAELSDEADEVVLFSKN